MLLKTREGNFEIVRNEILKMHPCETPCILKIEVEANESYSSWVLVESKVDKV